ncbi:MAG: SpoIIE family protein phosphatase [Candidatus Delongbacteria bacterium]
MSKRLFHGLLFALTGLLLAYMAVFFTREASKVAAWAASGTVQSSLQQRTDSLAIFERVTTVDFPAPPVPRSGDTLLALEDSLRDLPAILARIHQPAAPGRELRLSWRGADGIQQGRLRTRPVPAGELVSFVVLLVLRTLTAFAFALVGLWALRRRPDSPGVRALLLFSLSMASFMTVAVVMLNGSYAAFEIPGQRWLQAGLGVLAMGFSAFWLHLLLLFPRPLSWFRGRRWPVYLVCYLPMLLQGTAQVLPGQPVWLGPWIFAVLALQVLGGLLRLLWCVRHARSPLERRQGALVLMGSGPGLALLAALILLFNLLPAWTARWPQAVILWTISLVLLTVLLSPVSTAWAFGRYRLLEVEGRLRRGTRYALWAALLLAVLVAGLFCAAQLVLGWLQISARGAVLLTALLLALAAVPLQRRLMTALEGRVFPERQRLRDMVQGFHQRIIAMPDRASLWRHLEERLLEELETGSVVPVLREGAGTVCPSCGEATPFAAQSPLFTLLADLEAPLPLDELLASRRLELAPAEVEWLRARQTALLLPLRVSRETAGFLAVGAKRDGEDFSGEELRALSTLSSQVALAAENLRLLEENLEKRRLDEQLAMARRIQQRFLPSDLPATPGLEVMARSLFCLEVAGDYYDVVPLPDGRTVLAVGDVSGKGAGAAMLMANLQASLRTSIRGGGRLEEIVEGINQLICANTEDEQFITFFVGVFDPRSGRFFYVNAGHNPPLVIRRAGGLERLDSTGLLLGVLPEAEYGRGELELRTGDLLLLYTDGVSEALDMGEEEFGEARLAELARRHDECTPGELVGLIEREVVRFQGREGFADDFTLLVGRVGERVS